MRKFYLLVLAIALFSVGDTFAQTISGDFRTAQTSANWNTAAHWQTWNGANWITATDPPSAINNVYVQAGHTATLSSDASCHSLFISTGTATATTALEGRVALTDFVLNINGRLSCYFGAVDETNNSATVLAITPSATIPASPITKTANSNTARIKFTPGDGLNRAIIAAGEWSAGNTGAPTSFDLEVALNETQAGIIGSGVKAFNWYISSGILDVGANTISADNGTVGEGNITIAAGSTFISAATGTSNYVFQKAGNARAGILTVNGLLQLAGASPNIAMNSILFNGTVEYSRTTSTGNQSLAIAATGASSSASPDTYTNLKLSGIGVKTIPSALLISASGTVSITGSTSLTTSNNLTLKSTPNSTARIAQITSSATTPITGSISVERYIPAKAARKWSFVASPVPVSTIRSGWQDKVFITGAGTGGTPCGAGTGNGGETDRYNNSGFDATVTNAPSMFTYNSTAASGSRWVSIGNTTSTGLTPGIGYRMNIRGPRGSGDANCANQLNSANPDAPTTVTLSASGAMTNGINMKNVLVAVNSGTHPYTLLGNPYPSEINFTTFRSDASNSGIIADKFWAYSPENAFNVYSTYNGGTSTNFPASYTNPTVIASGQAFFVEATSGGSVTFKENHKEGALSQPGDRMFRTGSWNDILRIAVKDANAAHLDEVVIRFSNQSDVSNTSYGELDSRSFNDGGLSLISYKGAEKLAIQTRSLNFISDTVSIAILGATPQTLNLRFSEFENFTSATEILLIDRFKNTVTNVRHNPVYSFEITTDAASQSNSRFQLVFKAATILPLDFITSSAKPKTNSVDVSWKVATETNIASYIVERSTDGRTFNQLGMVAAKGNTTSGTDYRFIDNRPLNGTVYYRIKALDKNGEVRYSPLMKIKMGSSYVTLSLYPNPVKNQLNIFVNNPSSAIYNVKVTTANGVLIATQNGIQLSDNMIRLNTTSYPRGLYILELSNDKDDKLIEKFIK